MVRFVTTDSFLKVFSSYNLKTKVATLKTSDKFDNDSIIYITDATNGNWVYVKGHLYGEEEDSTNVSWTQEQQSGTKIASITIDGVSTDVYAPVNQGPAGDDGKSLEFTWGTGTNINKLGVRKEGDTNYTYSENLKGSQGPEGQKGEQGPQGEQGPTGPVGPTGADGKSLEFTCGTGTNANKLGVRKEGDTNYTYSLNLKGDTGPAGTYVNTDGLIAINGNNISLDHLKANLEIGEMDPLDLEAWFSGRDYPDGPLFADAAVWNKIGEYITVSYKNLRILKNWNETLYSLPVLCELPTHGVVKAGGSGLVLYWSIVAQDGDDLNVLRIAPLYDASLVWDEQTTITITYKFVLS